jgi:hypothetical protein
MAKGAIRAYGALIRDGQDDDCGQGLSLPPAFETAGTSSKRPYVE